MTVSRWLSDLLTGKKDVRRFRKVGGFMDAELAAIEIRMDDSGYRYTRNDGQSVEWETYGPGVNPHFTIAFAEQRVAAGQWEEL